MMRGTALRRLATVTAAAALAVGALGGTAAAAPGGYTQQQVNDAIAHGVGYLDTQQQANGSFGTSWPVGATGLALVSYGVLDGGKYANLPPAEQAVVVKAVKYLLSQAHPDGSFGSLTVYETSTTLMAFSYMGDVPTDTHGAVADAIAKGRDFLTKAQNAPPNFACQSDGAPGSGLGGQDVCGGWGYASPYTSWSDQSNTGFVMTALELTGGVPAAVAQANIGWNRNVQNWKATNPHFAMWNDGGGFYKPNWSSLDYTSNGNNTGSLLFNMGYDGVAKADPSVQAALAFGADVLSEYELMSAQPGYVPKGVSHTGQERDGTCVIGTPACTWRYVSNGGFHYSMFALSKGIGHYEPANLADPANYYAKIVDLLLGTQQSGGANNGAWLDDGGEFDGESPVIATGLSILALGRVGQPGYVTGTVWNDADGNGTRAASDQGVAGWTVYVDIDGSGSYDATKDLGATTAADGSYQIQQVPNGTYDVRLVSQSGYKVTAPAAGAYTAQKFATDVKLAGEDFGVYKVPPVTAQSTTTPVIVAPKQCLSVRRVTVHVSYRYRGRLKTLTAMVGKQKLVVHRGNGGWVIHLKGLNKGTYTVKFTLLLKNGKRVHDTRVWKTCTPTLPGSAPAIGAPHPKAK